MDAHRPGDVLDLLLAHVLERKFDLVPLLVAHDPADANATGFGQSFEPGGNVDPVAIDVASVPDDVADIDPHAELDPAIGRHTGVSLCHLALHFDSPTHRIDDTGEDEEQPIPGGFDDATAVFLDLGIGQLAAKRLQRGEGPLLVSPHQPRVAGYVGGKDRCEPTVDAGWPSILHGASPVANDPTSTRTRAH